MITNVVMSLGFFGGVIERTWSKSKSWSVHGSDHGHIVIMDKGTWNCYTYHCVETGFYRSERMKKISYISEIFAFHTIPPAVS